MNNDEIEILRNKVNGLEKEKEESRVVNNNIIAMVIGLAVYLAFGMGFGGGILGIIVAIVYLVSVKSFF